MPSAPRRRALSRDLPRPRGATTPSGQHAVLPAEVVLRALQGAGDPVLLWRVHAHRIVLAWTNDAGAAVLGSPPARVVGLGAATVLPDPVAAALASGIAVCLHGAGEHRTQIDTPDADGGPVRHWTVSFSSSPAPVDPVPVDPAPLDPEPGAPRDDHGADPERSEVVDVVTVWHDISDLVRREQVLGRAWEETAALQATFQIALDSTTDAFAVYEVDRDLSGMPVATSLVLINEAGAQALQGTPDELVGADLRDLDPVVAPQLWGLLLESLDRQVACSHRVERVLDGVWSGAWDHTLAPVGEERIVHTWRDVTAQAREERELKASGDEARWAATHDALTGLPNRALLHERLAEALAQSTASERVAVVYLDLDRFKQVNDTHGHAVGDELLVQTARRLSRLIRHADIAARLGGDEFVLVLTGIPAAWDPAGFLERATAALTRPVEASCGTLVPGASLGLVVAPLQDSDPEELLQLADERMYEHKRSRRAARGGDVPGEGPVEVLRDVAGQRSDDVSDGG